MRVYVNPARLEPYPETRCWFLGAKPKRKDKSDQLILEISRAQDTIYGVQEIRVKPDFLSKAPSEPRTICPECGEAYPAGHGPVCRGCRNGTVYYGKRETK